MPSEEEITVLLFMTAKEGKEEEFIEMATQATETTHAEDKGCINYVFHQQTDNSREFVLYEHWKDQASLSAHLTRLQAMGLPMDIADIKHSIRLRVVP
jgi:quinol monooxygenase YgiN